MNILYNIYIYTYLRTHYINTCYTHIDHNIYVFVKKYYMCVYDPTLMSWLHCPTLFTSLTNCNTYTWRCGEDEEMHQGPAKCHYSSTSTNNIWNNKLFGIISDDFWGWLLGWFLGMIKPNHLKSLPSFYTLPAALKIIDVMPVISSIEFHRSWGHGVTEFQNESFSSKSYVVTSWWLNQPIWTNMLVKLDHFLMSRKSNNIWKKISGSIPNPW